MYTFRLQADRPYYGFADWDHRDISWLCERLYPVVKVRISIDRTYYHRAYDGPSWHEFFEEAR